MRNKPATREARNMKHVLYGVGVCVLESVSSAERSDVSFVCRIVLFAARSKPWCLLDETAAGCPLLQL